MTRTLWAPALAMVCAAMAPRSARCQESHDALTPRALTDSTYAVRIALDAFAEGIRRGRLEERHAGSSTLGSAVTRLAAAASRASGRPRATLGVLWDFQLEVSGFEAVGPDLMKVAVHGRLATDADLGAPIILTLARRGERWDLVDHEGLAARLVQIASGIERKRGR